MEIIIFKFMNVAFINNVVVICVLSYFEKINESKRNATITAMNVKFKNWIGVLKTTLHTTLHVYVRVTSYLEEFEDTKGVIIIHIEGQTTQWLKEQGQKNKQRSTKDK